MYPQLHLPTDPHAQVSGDLSAMVVGDFRFDGMNHPTKVNRLVALIKLYETVLEIGDHEHTGDWDWRITVLWGDEGIAGTRDGEDLVNYTDSVICDTIKLDYTVEPGDYTDNFRRWEFLTVDEFANSDSTQDTDVLIPIDSIAHILISEA